MAMISNSEFFDQLSQLNLPLITDNKNIQWYNVSAGFDIETSSFYEGDIKSPDTKRAIMYIWMFGINGIVTYGRTWDEFDFFITTLSVFLNLSPERRIVIYVHNLPYEWQFIRKHFKWDSVFLLDDRKPVKARMGGLEFRCSLKLSGGKSLAVVGNELQHHNVKKAVGDLDYSLIRTPATPLNDKELGYCEHDILVLNAYIDEKIEQDGSVNRIPLTNTGYVREYCRKACFRAMEEVQAYYGGIAYES